MLTHTPEYEQYKARRKALLDDNTLISENRREAYEAGRREEKVDIVRKFQRMLRRTPDSTETLHQKSLQELERLETELEQLLLPDPKHD